ncbi:DUF927 domain-containing protein [Bacilliculturomica massiliensis]|uniref:DUF927 domain-containing protein n=1 Tax=Bacilliculturomica massiliensis TaxID=1917867 RepID=UPI001031DFED|nr:DUF927 domain-containing protein [Bacilliculturomica massiliensis]
MNEITTTFTKEDFLGSTAPFEEVYRYKDNQFELTRAIEQMSEAARAVKVTNFKKMFREYCAMQKQVSGAAYAENTTNFDGQEMTLDTGTWTADDYGITREGVMGEVVACVHPLMPVQRLVNIDSGIEKLKIAYRKGKGWRSIICDRKQLASANKIVELSDYGVAVTSENAKHLVQYIHDVENLNYERIPENNSVGRLGWIGNYGFSPYVDDLIFDGDLSFKHFFEAVSERGRLERWLEIAREIRAGSIYARIVLAASFASVLVEPCGALPFFVHLWGGTETGKTVALMLAASVWANPEMGRYIHTFNSTAVAQELSAAFVNSLPLIMDELQIVKDRKDFDNTIYQLSEGVGKNRGQKTGGLQKTGTWNNCIITTGEQPISGGSSGGGAVNRIIEINCEDLKLFDDPARVADAVKKNYGHAGKLWISELQKPEVMQQVKDIQKAIYKNLSAGDTTEKQSLSASLILAADTMTTLLIFKDDRYLSEKDIAPFLSTKAEVSQNGRAYAWLCEWVAQYRNKFDTTSAVAQDFWGRFEDEDTVCIIRNIFDKACGENGFNPKSFLTWLRSNNLIEIPVKGFTKTKKVNGVPCNCVVLRLCGFEEMHDENVNEIQNLLGF